MAVANTIVDVTPEQVWPVLADGHSYAEWVVGTKRIREVEGTWPEVGASLHFTVGLGPLTFDDRTTVRICEPGERLELEAFTPHLGTARIAIRLIAWGEGCLIVFDEHPLRGPARATHTAITEIVLQLRHRKMLSNLVRVIEQRAG